MCGSWCLLPSKRSVDLPSSWPKPYFIWSSIEIYSTCFQTTGMLREERRHNQRMYQIQSCRMISSLLPLTIIVVRFDFSLKRLLLYFPVPIRGMVSEQVPDQGPPRTTYKVTLRKRSEFMSSIDFWCRAIYSSCEDFGSCTGQERKRVPTTRCLGCYSISSSR